MPGASQRAESAPRIRAFVALAVVALALTGCTTGPSSTYADSARRTLEELRRLDPNDRAAAVMAHASAAELDARAAFGIDDALGGIARADDVLAGLRAPLAQLIDVDAPEDAFTFAPAGIGTGGGVGTFLGLAFTAVGMIGDTAMTLADQGHSGSETAPLPGGTAQITVGEDGSLQSTFETTGTQGATTARMAATTAIESCPAADGTLDLSGRSDVSITVGAQTLRIELDVFVTGRLDDAAKLAESDYTYRHQTSESRGSTGQFFDHSGGPHTDLTVNRNSSQTSLEFAQSAVDSAATFADLVANDLLKVAQRGWESGRCVTVTLTPSHDPASLEPAAPVRIDAASTSTLDGRPTGGSVSGTLAGEGSLSPAGDAQEAPATLTYVAAAEKHRTGILTATSRSKRGFGTATMTLTTGALAYTASGGADGLIVSGSICSLKAGFVLSGGGTSFTFTPTSDDGGTYRMAGIEEGVSYVGEGSYSVDHDAAHQAIKLVLDGDMSLSTSEGTTGASLPDMTIPLTAMTDTCQ
ncbi:hypothetical protein [Microbacterium sp.]|uniref:hypothetical protein n=1 Tax=Microbacterium sp. TaxID=51671 RepID=UPI003C70F7E8